MKKPFAILLLLFNLVSAQDFRQTVAVIDFDASGISQLEATCLTLLEIVNLNTFFKK